MRSWNGVWSLLDGFGILASTEIAIRLLAWIVLSMGIVSSALYPSVDLSDTDLSNGLYYFNEIHEFYSA